MFKRLSLRGLMGDQHSEETEPQAQPGETRRICGNCKHGGTWHNESTGCEFASDSAVCQCEHWEPIPMPRGYRPPQPKPSFLERLGIRLGMLKPDDLVELERMRRLRLRAELAASGYDGIQIPQPHDHESAVSVGVPEELSAAVRRQRS